MNNIEYSANQQRLPRRWTAPAVAPRYVGVGGWLLLLCIGLTVVRPLVTLGSLVSTYSDSSQYFDKFPGLMITTFIDTFFIVGVTAFGICAGVGLWRVQRHAVKVAKVYLLCMLGYAVVASILPFLSGLPAEVNVDMITPVAGSAFKIVIYVGIWYSYLNKSERVRATYGV